MSGQTQKEQVEHDVLLVNDKTKNVIQAVKGIDNNGNLETVPTTAENQNQFLKLDKQSDFFSNFFSNFFSQLKNPTEFSFFKVPEILAIKIADQMQNVLNQSEPNKELLLKYSIEELANTQKVSKNQTQDNVEQAPKEISQFEENKANQKNQQYNPYKYDIKDIDWDSLSKMGFSKEKLLEMDLLDSLLKGYKTKDLVVVNLDLGSVVFSLDAKISLEKNQQGKVVMAFEGVRKYPNLNVPFYGYEFSKEDKHNLLKTGNMGKVVDLVHPTTKEKIPSVVSVDRLTNNIIVTRVERMQLPKEVKGVVLSEQQLQTLKEGKPLFVEGMTSTKGSLFNAEIQFNAAKGHIEFLFDNSNKQSQSQGYSQNQTQHQTQGYSQLSDDFKTFRGKELDEKQQADLLAGKLVLVKDILDKKGNPYEGFVRYKKETNEVKFYYRSPEKVEQSNVESQADKQKNEPKKTSGHKI